MNAVDTSVAVAALTSWHEAHEASRRAARSAAIPAHARIETYSVLTRLPSPHRLHAYVATQLLAGWFPPGEVLVPSAKLSRRLVETCLAAGVDGGAVYDALVGLTAAESGRTLITRDERAAVTYERLGVSFEVVR